VTLRSRGCEAFSERSVFGIDRTPNSLEAIQSPARGSGALLDDIAEIGDPSFWG